MERAKNGNGTVTREREREREQIPFPFPFHQIFCGPISAWWPRFGDQGVSGRHVANGARGLGREGVSGNHGRVAVHPGVFLVCRLFVVFVVIMYDA